MQTNAHVNRSIINIYKSVVLQKPAWHSESRFTPAAEVQLCSCTYRDSFSYHIIHDVSLTSRRQAAIFT
jgi:hypothetical protein